MGQRVSRTRSANSSTVCRRGEHALLRRHQAGYRGPLQGVRAGGMRLLLEFLPVEQKVERVVVEVTVTYAEVDTLQRLMEESKITVEAEE